MAASEARSKSSQTITQRNPSIRLSKPNLTVKSKCDTDISHRRQSRSWETYIHRSLIHKQNILVFIPHHLISSFAPFIITMATRGLKINMGHNKLLAQTTHKAVYVLMRMVKHTATVCKNDRKKHNKNEAVCLSLSWQFNLCTCIHLDDFFFFFLN